MIKVARRSLLFGKHLVPVHRGFSGDLVHLSELSQSEKQLRLVVQREIDCETTDDLRESFISNYLIENGWHMKSNDQSTRIILSKRVGDCSVSVYFDAKFPAEDDSDEDEDALDEDPQGATESDTQDLKQAEDGNQFDDLLKEQVMQMFVLLEKDKEDQLLIEVYALNEELMITNMVIDPKVKTFLKGKIEVNDSIYQGPKFESLSKEFQEALQQYLHSLGINTEFAAFVFEAAYHQENRLYQGFLRKLSAFLQ